MGYVISFLNLKGGVGKTSTCHHLAGTFARMGKRVLLLDNDPQASLTQGFYGPAAIGSITAGESIAGLYDEDATPSPAALVRPTGVDGVWIIPGSPHLAVVNTTPAREWGPLETGLRDFLAPIRNSFDLTLVDNPPNLYLCAAPRSWHRITSWSRFRPRITAPKGSVRCGRPWGRCKLVRIPDSASRAIWSRCTTRGWPSTRAMMRSFASRSGPTCSLLASPARRTLWKPWRPARRSATSSLDPPPRRRSRRWPRNSWCG